MDLVAAKRNDATSRVFPFDCEGNGATEARPKLSDEAVTIDTDNIEELARLVNLVESELGFHFFNTKNGTRDHTNVVEAHWRGIQVDLETNATSCRFCEDYTDSVMYK
ncbi:hypothetical protein PI124_g8778 [Phytophthora idaei]|nr:hypothetical protein PI125_g11264 [Phytophthora idaei]KAG3158468.1 hypothetical protein PI126_g7836 [Phytophthora idaei]KAG3246508.1 hypothetical protein PI124_g8778 [Phytophthora idaei]